MLVQELVGGNNADAELTGFREHTLNAATSIGGQVLDFVAIDGVERPFFTREESVLEDSKDETSHRERLVAQLPFVKIDDHPVPLVHRLLHRERRVLLSHDVAEMRIGGKRGGLVEDRLPHRGPHCLTCLVIAKFEVLSDLDIRYALQAGSSKAAVGEQWRKFEQCQPVRGEHVE